VRYNLGMSAPGPSNLALLPLMVVALALVDPSPPPAGPIRTRTPRPGKALSN
jgi:hypothetical protein